MNEYADLLNMIQVGVNSLDEANKLLIQCFDAITELTIEKPKKRTLSQNAAVHKYCTMMADELNNAGYEYHMFIERVKSRGVTVEWSMEKFKDAWKMVQFAMFQKESTTELTTDEVSKVYEQVNAKFAEMAGVSMPFPDRRG